MGNRFFQPGEARAARVKELFDSIARRYDLINDLQSFGLHRRWKRQVLDLADLSPGISALDVCCGTGDLSWGMARRGAKVIGLDFSEEMLKVATSRTMANHATNAASEAPQFIRGDALQLPFQDQTFDVVTIGYGLRNLASWEAGLMEIKRVLKPGGRLIALEFGKPENALWRSMYFGYLKLFVPILGLVFCGNSGAYAYILESLKTYPAQRGVAARMQELNFGQVKIINLLGGAMSINCGEKAGR